ncbi:MAG: glycosyltransferase involved in cell wall biosynthesis [Planctomycetota bacterium]|jgi:glycosyltransferase involved in cell wall biosynthesis
MHVLFVLDTWGLIGGTERYASVVVPALMERGHRVTVLCREDQQPGFADVAVLEFPELEAGSLPKHVRTRLAQSVEAIAPDVIYVSAMRSVSANEVLVDLAPVVRYVHDHVAFCPGLNKYKEDGDTCREPMGAVCLQRYWLKGGCICFKKDDERGYLFAPIRELSRKQKELATVKRSARVLTNSRYMLTQLLQLDFDPSLTSILYYFTNSGSALADQPKAQSSECLDQATCDFLARDPEAGLLLTPARLTLPDKGVDYLLSTLNQVERPFRAIIAGTGPAEAWLRQKAIEDGVMDRVFFAGWQSSDAMEELYRRADVVVCPSVWDEPFGLVGLEAMAHETPIVAYEVGGIPDWLEHEHNGFLVPRKDTLAMARAIDQLLGDSDLRALFGRQGKALAEERFGRQEHVDALEKILTAACG